MGPREGRLSRPMYDEGMMSHKVIEAQWHSMYDNVLALRVHARVHHNVELIRALAPEAIVLCPKV